MAACPEKAIGLIKGKGHLVKPAVCIGHGAVPWPLPHTMPLRSCSAPPSTGWTFLRSIPISNECAGYSYFHLLGGMGLIRKAVASRGRQSIESIRKLKSGGQPLDVVIVGAGPAGPAASLGALEKKMRFVIVEQEDSLGGTVYHYPAQQIVMTAPMHLPMLGKVKMSEISKEALMEFWQGVVRKTGLKINFSERMETIARNGNGFAVKTSRGSYNTKAVLLAIGRRGTPRKLEVPGEDLPKVVYAYRSGTVSQ